MPLFYFYFFPEWVPGNLNNSISIHVKKKKTFKDGRLEKWQLLFFHMDTLVLGNRGPSNLFVPNFMLVSQSE